MAHDKFDYWINKYVSIVLIVILSSLGALIARELKLTMSNDTLFWFFSSIAQTFAALIALVAIFSIFRLELLSKDIQNKFDSLRLLIRDIISDSTSDYYLASNDTLEGNSENIKISLDPYESVVWMETLEQIKLFKIQRKNLVDIFKKSLSSTCLILIISIFLLPFSSVSSEYDLLNQTDHVMLEWLLIFSVCWLCFFTLSYMVYSMGKIMRDDL